MLGEWVTRGVGAGVTIFCAVFTVAVIAAVLLGLLGIGVRILKEVDDENEKRRTY